ncbi:glycosyltransferase [Rhizorhapis suberifaciens]|uniref:Beta-monoglucosyldiacylglycerol synthase n=1 Tax=Rhizorhapis suberifaciens TaxID=13656 RepID=A0A840HU62_9SPHN|nr:glycosyltransferase [Rhizorhapis suberifaciens]MBB4641463.1 cellulose synthase/poly-beta-1,6-N-acetylglucosamine synthase-like glycosyltransferase [Rhizorhapis suberifaciens]
MPDISDSLIFLSAMILALSSVRLSTVRFRVLGAAIGAAATIAAFVLPTDAAWDNWSDFPALLAVGIMIAALFAWSLNLSLRVQGYIYLFISGLSVSTMIDHMISADPVTGPEWVSLIIISLLLLLVSGHFFFAPLIENPGLNLHFRRLKRALAHRSNNEPFVSIIVPCYSEPPEVVIRTINALANVKYSKYEVIVVDNNTKDQMLWKPVEHACKHLGDKFRFFHIDPLDGAKAGALNFAHRHLDKRSTILCLVDADYVAQSDIFSVLIPLLKDDVAFVQASHDYMSWDNNIFLRGCYYEYTRFHKLSMAGLNEADVVFPVGTMVLLDRKAVERAGGWADWCLTEDSEIAIRLSALGYRGFAVADTVGRGLLPGNFGDVKKQIFRWSAGPIEQLVAYRKYYFMRGLESRGRDITKLILVLRNHLNYVVIAIRPFGVSLWLGIAYYLETQGSSFPLPIGLLVLWSAYRLWLFGERLISVRAMGSVSIIDFLFSIAVASALQFTKVQATLVALTGRRMRWRRTPKFPHKGSIAKGVANALPETILGFAFLGISGVLAWSCRHEFSLGTYAALQGLWLGITLCTTLFVSVTSEITGAREARRTVKDLALLQ